MVEYLIVHDGIKTFYVGNETAFDKVALAVLRALKKRYPHILYIVILTANPKNDSWLHEPTALFPNLAHVPYEVAIQKTSYVDDLQSRFNFVSCGKR